MLLKFSLFALASFVLTFAIAMLVAALIKAISIMVRKRDGNAGS